MTESPSFQFLADELVEKFKRLGKLGVRVRFVFEGHGVVHLDATSDAAVVTTDASLPAEFTVSAPYDVWLDVRAKRLAPHVAAMTRRVRIEGDLIRGMALIPRIMAVL